MECLICGKEILVFKTRGVKPKYCSDECRKKATYKAYKKYMAKRRIEKAKSKIDVNQQQLSNMIENESFIRKDKVIFRKSDASIDSVKYVSDVVEFGRELGALLIKAKQLKEKFSKKQSEYDKGGQEILHEYEKHDVITAELAIKIAQMAGQNRTPRRDVITLIEIIDGLVRGIPDNPPAFVAELIQNKEKRNQYYTNK